MDLLEVQKAKDELGLHLEEIRRARRNGRRVGALKHRERWALLEAEHQQRLDELRDRLRLSWVEPGGRER